MLARTHTQAWPFEHRHLRVETTKRWSDVDAELAEKTETPTRLDRVVDVGDDLQARIAILVLAHPKNAWQACAQAKVNNCARVLSAVATDRAGRPQGNKAHWVFSPAQNSTMHTTMPTPSVHRDSHHGLCSGESVRSSKLL